MTTTPPQPITPKDDDIRWLALLIRQALKGIVVGIEQHYGLDHETQKERKERKAA